MKRPRLTTIILALLLIGSNLFWIYGIVDQGVTLTYTESSFESAQSSYEQLLILANKNPVGLSAEEAMAKVGKDIRGLDPFIKEGCLYFGQVCLRLDSKGVIEGYGKNAL